MISPTRLMFYMLLALPAAAGAQVLPPVDSTIDRLDAQREALERRVESRLERERRAAEAAARAAGQSLPENATDPLDEDVALIDQALDAGQSVAEAAGSTVSAVAETANGLQRVFVADVDAFGQPIEKNVLVVLVDSSDLASVRGAGLSIIAEREMNGLGMTLLTLEAANGYALADKALELRRDVPGASVDYNHLYRLQQADRQAVPDDVVEAGGHDADATTVTNKPAEPLRIGIIDSDVAADHAALSGLSLVREDFVTFDAERPRGHGTAVASLVAEASDGRASVFAASVFFQVPQHAPGASTESLVAALDWLALQDVDAINMSLAGPANALLETAIDKLAQAGGPPVVAAVGNNGPAGEPLFPGAYDAVIGVTAVDRENRVFRYANRGEHVDFAARGVNVKVADAGGSWRIESGTSMASPRIAVVVATTRRKAGSDPEALRALLRAGATDLGPRGFDPVFGHGLLTEPPVIAAR